MTRRDWLALGAALPLALILGKRTVGAQGLDRFATPSVPCKDDKPTPAAADARTFKTGSPQRAAIAPGLPGRKLTLTGAVAGVICGPIKGAVVDVWQADGSGAYDMNGFRLRGHQLTDALGVYRFETIMPGSYAGRAPHLNVRVQAPGKPALITQVFFPDEPANKTDPHFKPELVVKVLEKAPAQISASFNFILNA
jgi:protocatechuate 3,4-dioxygenase beta subunit